MIKLEAKIIIDGSLISFEGASEGVLHAIMNVWNLRISEAEEKGKRQVVDSIIRNIEKLANKE